MCSSCCLTLRFYLLTLLAFDSIRQGGPTKSLCRCFGARLAGFSLITYK